MGARRGLRERGFRVPRRASATRGRCREESPLRARTLLLGGIPRSGTSLCCRLAGEVPDTVALSEPFDARSLGGEMPGTYRPLVDFMIIGAQKGGTNALYRFLREHPEVGMSSRKEVHLFDAPEYSRTWTPEQIDLRYRPFFEPLDGDERVRGEGTPIYLYFPEIAGELARYNPALKLIVLLRDPVERAISHYYMEKSRDAERLPLWLALLCEPFRLRRCRDPRARGSAMRVASYRSRGLYSRQLRNLYRHFDPDRVLVLRTSELQERHDAVLRRVFRFLCVDDGVRIAPRDFSKQRRGGRKHRVVSLLLRLSYLRESARLRALLPDA